MNNYYDFSSHMGEILSAHDLLQESRDAAETWLANVQIDDLIINAVLEDGANVDVDRIHRQINGLWTTETIKVKIDFFFRTLFTST